MSEQVDSVAELESQIEIRNYSDWDLDLLTRTVNGIANDLGLKGEVWFIFQETWTQIDDEGNLIEGSEQDLGWDGDAFDNGVVRVCISKTMQFPFRYNINGKLIGFYMRHIAELRNPPELLIYMAAHEMRHLWQWENPEKAEQIGKLLRGDDETDADIYALMTLSRHRSGTTVHPFLRGQYDENDCLTGFAFWCPGCAGIDPAQGLHVFPIKDSDSNSELEWQFDGKSSFEPSLAYEDTPACHLHLTDGQIRYYPDCTHSLAGQIVEMVPIPLGADEERS